MLKKYIKVLALKLYASAKSRRNWYIQKLGSDLLVDTVCSSHDGENSVRVETDV